MPSPYPPVPFQLETALLVTLRDTLRWESSLAPIDSSGTYSGTLTSPNTNALMQAGDYQRRDRELAWLDTRNAAAVVQVALDVADVWSADAQKPTMEGPQVAALTYQPQDVSSAGLTSKVVHVKYASISKDAISTDRDLAGRDFVIYETLNNAVQSLFTQPHINRSAAPFTPITSWSYASGTALQADINNALPLSRDTYRNPDFNLADRDNQMAGYVAQMCQVLKNPFAFANRLYVGVYGVDGREIETYSLAQEPFVPGTRYLEGSEIYFQGTAFGVLPGVGSTTDVPWTSPWAWAVVPNPRTRTWTAEPALPGRNRFLYDTQSFTLQWFRDTNDVQHVPQLVALSIPGICSGQTLAVTAKVPEQKDGMFWRNKAAHVVPSGGTVSSLFEINPASFLTTGFTLQTSGASMTIPSTVTAHFPDPATGAIPQIVPPGIYRVSALVEPNSTVELAGDQNSQGVSGTLGGADYPGYDKLTWGIGLPPTQWTVEIDYTNVAGSTNGFQIVADLDNNIVFDNTAPLYFNDPDGNPLPNGQVVTSPAFPIFPTGGKQVFGLNWNGGTGQFHVRALRFKTEAAEIGRYRMTGTFASQVATVDVLGEDGIPGVMSWDFTTGTATSDDFAMTWEKDAILPIRFMQLTLNQFGTTNPTPTGDNFANYRNDCVVRATKSAQQAFTQVVKQTFDAFGTLPTFSSDGTVWDTVATERWMALMEQAEPRLREVPNIALNGIVPTRQYFVSAGSAVYEGQGYGVGKGFIGNNDTVYVWAQQGTLNQAGAWRKSKPQHNGRPALTPAGVYFDIIGGTALPAYAVDRTTPELTTIQPWMIETGFYVAQMEFVLPNKTVPPIPIIQPSKP